MTKILTKIGTAVRKLLPTVLKGREKAVAGFLTPFVAGQLAHFVPSLHFAPSTLDTLILSGLTAITVHTVTNVPAKP